MTLTVNHSTPADGSFSATGATAWNAAHTLSGTIDIANGGTGQTTSTAAINALLPTQATNSGKYLTTDGTNTSWATVSGGGSVTSVGATSPVASSGGTAPTISLNAAYGDTLNPYASKTANYVLASPDGSSGVPTFRALVSSDIPSLNYQAPITLTTTGTSGAATFVGNTLNIPQYTGGGGSPNLDGGTPTSNYGGITAIDGGTP